MSRRWRTLTGWVRRSRSRGLGGVAGWAGWRVGRGGGLGVVVGVVRRAFVWRGLGYW